MRGASGDGHVANYVETEMIVQANGCMASYVQVRYVDRGVLCVCVGGIV